MNSTGNRAIFECVVLSRSILSSFKKIFPIRRIT